MSTQLLEDCRRETVWVQAMADIMSIFAGDSMELDRKFQEAKEKGAGTSDEISDFREGIFKVILSRYFPANTIIEKGKIIDKNKNVSDSIDGIVINPIHPRLFDRSEKLDVVFADGVDFCVEVKPDLTRKDELIRGLQQGLSVRKLQGHSPYVGPSKTEQSKEFLENGEKIPFFLFCVLAPKNVETLFENIKEFYIAEKIPLAHQIDAVFCNNRFILNNNRFPNFTNYSIPDPGWYVEDTDVNTLARTIEIAHMRPASSPTISPPVILNYIEMPKLSIRKLSGPIEG